MKKLLIILVAAWACTQAPQKPRLDEEAVEPAVETDLTSSANLDSLVRLGVDISAQSQQALGGQLKSAMTRGGVAEAIHFCNLNAIKLTDSLSNHFGITISRLTNKPRNPSNALSPADAEVFDAFLADVNLGYDPTPTARHTGDMVAVYVPIKMQPFCLTCHGKTNEGLLPEAAKLIAESYPEDKATGYTDGELRGMWRILFSNK